MIYLFLVNSTFTLCYLLYILFFKRLTFFQLNRLYLLGSVLLSLLIPIGLFIDVSAFSLVEEAVPSIDLSMLLADEFLMEVTPVSTLSFTTVLSSLYWAGVLIALAWLAFRLLYTLYILRSKKSSFSCSFFHHILLGEEGKLDQAILAHEQVHVKQGHSYDILLLELVRAFNWFNPVGYYYLKELKFQHECIADALCAEDKVVYAELLLAQAMQVDPICFAHEFSNQSILKNRIMMLFKDKSKNRTKLRYFSFVPVALLTLFSTLVFNSSKAQKLVREFEAKLEETNFKAVVAEQLNVTEQVQEFAAKPVQTQKEQQLSNSAFTAITTAKLDAQAQQQDTSRRVLTEEEKKRVFMETEVMPEPVGGIGNFRKWVSENYKYPQAAIDAGIVGKITVSFIVEMNGSLSNFQIVEDLGHGTGQALVEVLQKAKKWKPGIQNGRVVRVQYNLPMTLDLS